MQTSERIREGSEVGRAVGVGEVLPSAVARATAGRLYKARADRVALLGPGLFADPAWDMLLDLTIMQGRRRLGVSAACLGSQVAHATGMRHLGLLLERGLVERTPDPLDRRRTYVRLTAHGVRAMEAVLAGFA